MKRIEYNNVADKSSWLRGPWDNEPDKIQWQDTETGLPCLIVRGPFGALCGYVGVPLSHPLHGKSYNEVDLTAHGGLNFSASCQKGAENAAICHIPADGEPDHIWWFGFDCAHSGDLCPSYAGKYMRRNEGIYRALNYVEKQVQLLAKQIAGDS